MLHINEAKYMRNNCPLINYRCRLCFIIFCFMLIDISLAAINFFAIGYFYDDCKLQ